jgi:hypothetical protein
MLVIETNLINVEIIKIGVNSDKLGLEVENTFEDRELKE